MNLGTMNGWKMHPKEYEEHLEHCGTERSYLRYTGDPNKPEQAVIRDYQMIVENLGNCYNRYTCQDCGISYTVDSSG